MNIPYFHPVPKNKPIRLKGKAKRKLRIAVFEREDGICQDCKKYAPLNGTSIFDIGHEAHIKSVGSGGEDKMDNVRWLCYSCHIIKEHGPRWSKNE